MGIGCYISSARSSSRFHHVLLLLCLCTSPSQGNFTYVPDAVYVCVGDTILLDWQFTGDYTFYHWTKHPGSIELLSVINGGIYDRPSYAHRLVYNGNGNITLLNAVISDTGIYWLELVENILDISTYKRSTVDVTVYEPIVQPPTIRYDSRSNSLTCSTQSVGYTSKWTWNMNTTPGPSLSPTASGIYNCSIQGPGLNYCTKEGVETFSSITLELDKPIVRARFPTVHAIIGESVTLQCYIIEAIPGKITEWRWYRHQSPERILSDTSSLSVSHVSVSDLGQYQCTATNQIGRSDPVTVVLDLLEKDDTIIPESDTSEGLYIILAVVGGTGTFIILCVIVACLVMKYYQKRKRDRAAPHFDLLSTWSFPETSSDGISTFSSLTHYNQINENVIDTISGGTESTTYNSIRSNDGALANPSDVYPMICTDDELKDIVNFRLTKVDENTSYDCVPGSVGGQCVALVKCQCRVPKTDKWIPGRLVKDSCNSIAKGTVIATFKASSRKYGNEWSDHTGIFHSCNSTHIKLYGQACGRKIQLEIQKHTYFLSMYEVTIDVKAKKYRPANQVQKCKRHYDKEKKKKEE